ncbi:hypothetical protein CVT24_001275 [Panaeolus cyanescens]|uniref:Bromo domain-containing protein n=1 Tax=Panaeolus cyanescens TaxID=181874 RepID=A0A409YFZ4_9AGAR|nr:hypothetical protein CVT24_001275 [Panaeolus cyanescens]
MSKREHDALNGSRDIVMEGSRPKRRREVGGGGASSDMDIPSSDLIEGGAENGDIKETESPEQVREQGLVLWQTVKDAVNKDGRALAVPFLRKPPKRQYPDYYELIKKPIALDDIKKQLDSDAYSSIEDVKADFELLFGNAKQYNQTESEIFQDAKELLKLVNKTYSKMVPDEHDDKPKTPSLSRLAKIRVDKLVAKTDASGRKLSDEFMQLPSRKLWPQYYKEIKHPQCFDNVYKKIKRKEYRSAAEFAADTELIFSNATTFNQEYTQIWNDAVTLREYFKQLMSDLPAPYSLPEYARQSNKIKIKPPQAAQASTSTALQKPKPESALPSTVTLRVPGAPPPKAASQAPPSISAHVPVAQSFTLPVAPVTAPVKPTPTPAPKALTPQIARAPVKSATPQPVVPVSFVNAIPSHYPNSNYMAPPVVQPTHTPTPPILQTTTITNTQPSAPSPAPVALPLNHQLKSIHIRIQPKGRTLTLDQQDGVKSWSLRLGRGETTFIISDVSFMGEEEDESSDEDDDDDMDVDIETPQTSPKANGRKKGKRRGRPPKAVALAAKAQQAAAAARAAKAQKKKEASKIGEVQLKLNGVLVSEQTDNPGEWNVNLPVGSNTIEIGERGGMIWKIYAVRPADL